MLLICVTLLLLALQQSTAGESMSTSSRTKSYAKAESTTPADTNVRIKEGAFGNATKKERLRTPETYAFYVRTEINHRFASTLLTRRMINRIEKNRTAVFEAYIPRSAFVVDFAVAVDGQVYRGEIGERPAISDAARERKLLSSMAVMLARSDEFQLFRCEVIIRPNTRIEFNLTYQELLHRRIGLYEHAIFLNPGRVVDDLRVDVKIRESAEILNAISRIETTNSTANGTQVRLRKTSRNIVQTTFSPSTSEQSTWWSEGGTLNARLAVQYDVRRRLDGGEIQIRDGYFVHYFAASELVPIDKNVIFILDISSSMGGVKQTQVIAAMMAILDQLRPSDMFNIILFSSTMRYWIQGKGAVAATAGNVQSAKEFVRAANVSSGSNMNDALLRGIDFLVQEKEQDPLAVRISMIVLLTDGNPTSGVTEYDRILSNVRQANGARVCINAVAVGRDATFALLRKLAQQNRGVARRVSRSMGAAEELKAFYSEISNPLLENVRVRYNDVVEDTSLSEVDFPAYFEGSELVVVGRLKSRTGNLMGKVFGSSARVYMALDVNSKIPKSERDRTTGLNFAEKAWTHVTIRKLLRKTLEYINDTIITSAVATVRQMSLHHSIMTSLTCMSIPKLRELRGGPVCLADPDEDLPEESGSHSADKEKIRLLAKTDHNKKESGSQQNKHYSFADNDPHFLVMVGGLKEGVCFDIDGQPGIIYQLIHDKETGLVINALIVGKNLTNEFPNVKTYLGKISILFDRTSVVVDPEYIVLNSALHDWKANATFNVSVDVAVEITPGRHVTVFVKDVAVLRILRHMVKPSHPYKVNYLGFYVEDGSGLSQHIHGLIGQFTHQTASMVRSSLELHTSYRKVKLQARLTFSGPHVSHRTVGAVLSDRRDMDLKQQTPCWHVPHNGLGLIKGDPEDYVVPYLHFKRSSFFPKNKANAGKVVWRK